MGARYFHRCQDNIYSRTIAIKVRKMTTFELKRFVLSPALEELTSLTKVNLLTVVQLYKLSVTEAMSKAQIRKLAVQYLQEEKMLSESAEIMETGGMTGKKLLQLKANGDARKRKRARGSIEIKGA